MTISLSLCLLVVNVYFSNVKADKAPIEPVEYKAPSVPPNAFFGETFENPNSLGDRWIVSKGKKQEEPDEDVQYDGKWLVGLPQDVLLTKDYGLIMKSPAHHHAVSAKLKRVFRFKSTPLVVQYDVKFQDMMECGGGYVKLLSQEKDANLNYFNNKTPFTIMFGPDKCGSNSKVHFIIRHKNPITGEVTEHNAEQSTTNLGNIFQDKKTHLFTLVLNPDDTYYVYVDQSEIMRGNLLKNLKPDVVPPAEIDDPNDQKPQDWDEREKIPDEDAVKPEDWDESQPEFIQDVEAVKPKDWYEDEPEFIPDPNAAMPNDWDEDMDGKWEPPLIPNPKCKDASGCGLWKQPTKANPLFKGKWSPPLIANPNYQGKWKPKKIDNPSYFLLQNVFETLDPIAAVGLELWTITPEVIFDNFLIVDNEEEAKNFAKLTWHQKKAAEALREENPNIFKKLIKETETKPWLWAVYAVVILLPVVLTVFWCFGSSKKIDIVAVGKKHDTLLEDDAEEENDEQTLEERNSNEEDDDGDFETDEDEEEEEEEYSVNDAIEDDEKRNVRRQD